MPNEVEKPKIPTLSERIGDYLKTVKPAEIKLSYWERLGFSLWNTVSNFFSIMWDTVWDNFRKALSGIFEDITKLFFKQLTTVATPGIKEWIKGRVEVSELPQASKDSLITQLAEATPLDYLWVFLFTVFANMGMIASLLSAGYEVGRQTSYKALQPSLPSLSDVFNAVFRDPTYEPLVDDLMSRMGFNKDIKSMIRLASWSLLDADSVRDLYLRGEITKSERELKLKQLGIRGEDLDKIEKLYYFIPSPTDLVRMAVKEAFTPEIAEKFGQYQDFPPAFAEWSKKQGMSDFWARAFWASHWDLPSATEGFEMLHRRVISDDEMKMLLRALDVMPFWRDKLIKISYYPYTRVDVRRMYRAGVLKKEDVYLNYRDLGYDDDKAKKLTDFTVRDAMEKDRDLSKADVLACYERKTIDRNEAKTMLQDLKYSSDEAEVYLDKVDYDLYKKYKDKEVALTKSHYVAGTITEAEARSRLAKLDLKGEEVTELFRDWDLDKEAKAPELTFKQIQQLFIKRIITEGEFRNELGIKGYSEKNIEWLFRLTRAGVVEGG